MFPYRLAAIDIDETLIGPDHKISRDNRRAVKRLPGRLGCRVVLASGRRHANMLPYCDELGLDDFVVSSQGARVEHARTGEILPPRLARVGRLGFAGRRGAGGHGSTVLLWLNDRVVAEQPTSWIGASMSG